MHAVFLLLVDLIGGQGGLGEGVVLPPGDQRGHGGAACGDQLLQLFAVDGQQRLAAGAQQLIGQRQQKHHIADNDFSYDPEIEKAGGELGQIGHTVNEMTMSIENLLQTTEQSYEQRRKIEIQLLQSQVNPHFLYNTLDSIRWMAVIQKSLGIESMTRSMSNLLKNIAKGTQDKITLEEELALLHDYVEIQSVRYMEAFTFCDRVPKELYCYRIIKLTLQPLVENAIFHGIEPTGENGTITVTGREEGSDLVLCVTDDGAGITPDVLPTLLSEDRPRSHAALNGIGVCNVHKRLQMLYGEAYGLTIESEPGSGTCVTVRVPKEE